MLRIISSMRSVAHLQLHLNLQNGSPLGGSPVATLVQHQQHATSLQHLSSLTALTHLHLLMPHRRRADLGWGSLHQLQQRGATYTNLWRAMWNTQQASLASALRCMPQLQHLGCEDFHLQASDVGSLTALTHLSSLAWWAPPPQPLLLPLPQGPPPAWHYPRSCSSCTCHVAAHGRWRPWCVLRR